MHDQTNTPLRGDAAWRAAKAEVAKRNDAAYKRGAAQREAEDERAAARRLALDRRDAAELPEQPQP